jgi:hypothetical protein
MLGAKDIVGAGGEIEQVALLHTIRIVVVVPCRFAAGSSASSLGYAVAAAERAHACRRAAAREANVHLLCGR